MINRLARTFPSARATLLLGGAIVICYLLFSSIGVQFLQNSKLFNLSKHPDLYGDVASNIAQGNGYRLDADGCETMFREPGYILTVAAVYSVFGESPTAARMVNVVLLALTAWLTLLLAQQVGLPPRGARLAAFLVLVFPSLVLCMLRVSPEVLFTTLVMATLLFMTIALDRPIMLNFGLAGLFLALTALVRSIALPFALVFVLLAIHTLRRTVGTRTVLIRCMAFCLAFGMMFGIWPLRNYLLSGHLVVTATVSGDSIFQGMYVSKLRNSDVPYDKKLYMASVKERHILERKDIPYWGGFYQFHDNVEDEIRHAVAYKAEALREYRADPWLFAHTVVRHIWAFWFKGRKVRASLLIAVYMVPLMLVAGFGLRRAGAYPHLKTTLLFMAVFYLLHLPILAHSRHNVPIVPLLLLLAVLNLPPLTNECHAK